MVKDILYSVLLILVINTLSNSVYCQFKVLEARNAYHEGKELFQFDRINANGAIQVHNGGFLSLVYKTGRSIELKSEELIVLDSLPYLLEMTTLEFPEIRNVLDTTHFFQGSTLAGLPTFFSAYGSSELHKINKGDSVCLMWRSRRPTEINSKIGLVVTNVFDEVLTDTIYVEGSGFKISTHDFNPSRSDDPEVYLVYITDGLDAELGIALAFDEKNYKLPDFCNPKNATDYVVAAFYLEGQELYETAIEYYNQAVKLSDEQIFKDILTVARIRIDRYR